MFIEDRIRAELRETDVKFVRLDETAIVAVSHSFLSRSFLLILLAIYESLRLIWSISCWVFNCWRFTDNWKKKKKKK